MIANGAFITDRGIAYEHVAHLACPCCGLGFWVSKVGISTDENPVTVFCGNGRCESRVTNNGASGRDVEAAQKLLAELVEQEQLREYWAETLVADDEAFASYEQARNEQIRNDGL